MTPDDPIIEWSIMEREILSRIRAKIAREQCGEAFMDLTGTAVVRSLSVPTDQGSDCRSTDNGEANKFKEGHDRRGGPA